jgi:hypothetical protein
MIISVIKQKTVDEDCKLSLGANRRGVQHA